MPGKLEEIYISPKSAEPMQALQQVNLIAGQGLEGDRYNFYLRATASHHKWCFYVFSMVPASVAAIQTTLVSILAQSLPSM